MEEKIKARIEELQKAKEQFLANLNACEGAIGELNALLVKKEPAKDTDPTPPKN